MSEQSIVPGANPILPGGASPGAITRTLRAELAVPPASPFAVENLAGVMTVMAGDGDTVTVEATVHADSEELAAAVRIEEVTGRDGRPTLRISYPLERQRDLRYPCSMSNLQYGGHTVKISRTGEATLFADVVVRVPERSISAAFANYVGSLSVERVTGRITLGSASADVTARRLSGDVRASTGSGHVLASDLKGSFACENGSGGCAISSFDGEAITCKTGSGDVTVSDSRGARLVAATGSGTVRIAHADFAAIEADTGSGGIQVDDAGGQLRRLRADTGSGGVVIRLPQDASFELRANQGSGKLASRFTDAQRIISGRKVVGLRRGDGRIAIEVKTGSGNLVIAPAP